MARLNPATDRIGSSKRNTPQLNTVGFEFLQKMSLSASINFPSYIGGNVNFGWWIRDRRLSLDDERTEFSCVSFNLVAKIRLVVSRIRQEEIGMRDTL
jgi:hypothetical protein